MTRNLTPVEGVAMNGLSHEPGLKITLAAVMVFGLGVPARAQVCPAEGSICANQVIAKDLTTDYQKAGEASRVNGTGPRMYNKVEKIVLYDIIPGTNHQQGKDAVRRMMVRLANRYGFELVINDDAVGWIRAERLAGANMVILNDGDKDVLGNDNPTAASVIAMENYIYRLGGSLMMIHSANALISCTVTGGELIGDPNCRFLARAAVRQYDFQHQSAGTQMTVYVDSTEAGQLPPYGSLGAPDNLGPAPREATFPHGRANPETKNIFDNSIPFNWPLPPNSPTDPRTYVWDNWGDEWFHYLSNPRNVDTTMIRNVTNFTPAEKHIEGRVNVLLALDEMSRDIGSQKMGNHPMSWTRRMGKGLSAYVNIGHNNVPFLGRSGDGRTGVDSVAAKYYWNLIRYLSRDYEGCTEPGYSETNPHASVKFITGYENSEKPAVAAILPLQIEPCANKTTSISNLGSKNSGMGIRALSGSIEIATPDAGSYGIYVFDLKGREVFSRSVMGGKDKMIGIPDLGKGSYFVRVSTPKSGLNAIRVNLD